jgi:hypothetical protein
MSVRLADRAAIRRRTLALESLRMLVNIELNAHTECYGVHVRRVIVTEPDASGCNWTAEWPVVRAANLEPCYSQLRAVVDQLRERYNVEQ